MSGNSEGVKIANEVNLDRLQDRIESKNKYDNSLYQLGKQYLLYRRALIATQNLKNLSARERRAKIRVFEQKANKCLDSIEMLKGIEGIVSTFSTSELQKFDSAAKPDGKGELVYNSTTKEYFYVGHGHMVDVVEEGRKFRKHEITDLQGNLVDTKDLIESLKLPANSIVNLISCHHGEMENHLECSNGVIAKKTTRESGKMYLLNHQIDSILKFEYPELYQDSINSKINEGILITGTQSQLAMADR